MPNLPMMKFELPKTISEQEFELMCVDVLAEKYPNMDGFRQHGERGQLQEGIDICSMDPNSEGKFIVAQCKNYLKGDTIGRLKKQIEKDVKAAAKMDLKIDRFIAMTSVDSNTELIKYFANLNEEISEFKVSVMFWGDIAKIIKKSPNLMAEYYETLFPLTTKDSDDKVKTSENKVLRYTDDPAYMKKWTEKLWLFPDNKNITYENAYVKPEYSLPSDSPSARRSGEELERFLSDLICGKYEKRGIQLILGSAGGGKSSLFLRMWNNPEVKSEKIAYFSCRNLNKLFWEKVPNETARTEYIAENLLKYIYQECPEIDSNTTILLDGFDELSISELSGRKILAYLNEKVKYSRMVRGILITCRRNFFTSLKNLPVPYLLLKTFSVKQIKKYVNNCHGVQNFDEMNPNMAEIYGIPLILYMITASELEVKESGKVIEVYDRLFDVESGIYHRSIRKNLENEGEPYGVFHSQISDIARSIHKVSQKIAYYMFENEPNRLVCPKEEIERYVEEECNLAAADITYQKLLIGSFFNIHHTEGTENISFIHRSMYEYFTCVYISEIITQFWQITEEFQMKAYYQKMGALFKTGFRTELMKDYLRSKIKDKCDKVYNKKLFFKKWEKMLVYLLENGMLGDLQYSEKISLHNRLTMESNSLFHLLEITQILYSELEMTGLILKDSSALTQYLPDYFRFPHENKPFHLEHFDLNQIYLRKLDLTRNNMDSCSMESAILRNAHLHTTHLNHAILSEADIFMADMRGCELNYAELINTDMKESNLFEAQLIKAILISAQLDGANLRRANLREADLTDASLKNADLSGADLSGAVLRDTNMENAIFDDENDWIRTFDFSEAFFDYIYIGKKRYSHEEVLMMQKGQRIE